MDFELDFWAVMTTKQDQIVCEVIGLASFRTDLDYHYICYLHIPNNFLPSKIR